MRSRSASVERPEADDVVDAVHELRLEELPGVTRQVRGHDEHGVGEVHRAALAVGEPAVVEDLQQDVEHVRVRLLDLVEQHHRVGPAAHRLGELAALLVADVAGRRADEPGHGVLLHVLAHVDADHGLLVVEEELGQGPGQLGLADAGGPEEDERADGPVGVGQAGAAAPDGVGHGDRRPRPGRPPARAGRPPCGPASAISPSISRLTGMPVHLLTTSAMSSSSTSSLSIFWADCSSSSGLRASASCRSSSGSCP